MHRRERCARRARPRRRHLERWTAHLDDLSRPGARLVAAGRGAATRGSSRSARSSATTHAALRARGQAEFDRLDAEMSALARDAAGNAGLRRGPARGRAAPPADRAGDARHLRGVDRASRARSSCETGLVTLPPGETCEVVPSPVFQRPILGRRVVHRAAGVLRPLEGPLLRAVRARRRLRGGDPVAAVEQLLRLDPDDVAVHEAYPGHHWHLVMRKANRVGRAARSTRRPTSARAGRCTPSASCASAGFFEDPIHELHHLERDDLPRRADHRRHVAPPGRDDLRRGGRLHAGQGGDARAGRDAPRSAATAGGRRRRRRTSPAASRSSRSASATSRARGFAGVAPRDVPIEVLREFHDAIATSGALPLGLAERAVRATAP